MFATMMMLTAAALQQDPPIIVEGQKLRERPVCRTERQTGSRVVRQICGPRPSSFRPISTQPTETFKRPMGE